MAAGFNVLVVLLFQFIVLVFQTEQFAGLSRLEDDLIQMKAGQFAEGEGLSSFSDRRRCCLLPQPYVADIEGCEVIQGESLFADSYGRHLRASFFAATRVDVSFSMSPCLRVFAHSQKEVVLAGFNSPELEGQFWWIGQVTLPAILLQLIDLFPNQ